MAKVLTFYKSSRIFIIVLNWASIGVCFNRMPITIGKFSFNLITIIWIKVNLYPVDGLIAFKDFSFSIKIVPVIVDVNVAIGTKVYFSTRIFVVEVAIITKGELVTVDGKIHYYDANSGARLSNIDITIKGQTYHFDADGNGTLIS